ncbi:hypothetical protein C482_01520 [Natrialba chahannaoensis JCM 10990]|uniref:Halobacterial output domain-containing protein n=1 Tax=Natrialba chahannaoensis JCM 10990 TaxID=1227492 RepID=M0B6C4_9EURY|nr:HalOD1 output domain-containing protein [Natrialba chahannaoensis]ELZ06456.1 hypothetical protein C482_01520 [Natrialba chahannaoensis JCM 10990]
MPSSDDTCDTDPGGQESADELNRGADLGAETETETETQTQTQTGTEPETKTGTATAPDVDSEPQSERDPLEYTTSFDPTADSPSEHVILTIAALTDIRPAQLPALAHVIDPDALDRVYEHATTKVDAGEQEVWFTYAGFDVGLHSSGTLTVRSATVTGTDTDVDADEDTDTDTDTDTTTA